MINKANYLQNIMLSTKTHSWPITCYKSSQILSSKIRTLLFLPRKSTN